jgi:hypothetical protein
MGKHVNNAPFIRVNTKAYHRTCVPLANQDGHFVLGPGAHSVLANCAEDAVPGSHIF